MKRGAGLSPGLPVIEGLHERILSHGSGSCKVVKDRVRRVCTMPTIDAPAVRRVDLTHPVPFLDLEKAYPNLRPPVVCGLARVGETVNIIGPSKFGKSWFSYGLALSIANGKPFLGMDTKRGRVLLVDNELHPETIVYRIRKVADVTELSPERIEVFSLRGRSKDYFTLKAEFKDQVRHGKYVAIVIDAHYRMLPEGDVENSNGIMKAVYNAIDEMADMSGAAWFLIHHPSRGDQSNREVIDVGAGAGAQVRAADTHLIARAHETDGCYVLEAVCRSFPPFVPVAIQWELPLFKVAADMDTNALRSAKLREKRRQGKADLHRVLKALVALYDETERPVTANKLRSRLGMDRGRCEGLLERLVSERLAGKEDIETGGKAAKGYLPLPVANTEQN